MSEYNERRLLRRLQALSQIEPTPELTQRALRNAQATVEKLDKHAPPNAGWCGLAMTPRGLSAAAAGIVILVLIGAAALMWRAHVPRTSPQAAHESTPEPSQAALETTYDAQAAEPQVPPEIERELRHILALAQTGDMQGLMDVLDQGSFAGKLVAASYLTEIGDLSAIAPLEELSARWYGDNELNPFAAAVSQIRQRLEKDHDSTPIPEPQTERGDTEQPHLDPVDSAPRDLPAAGQFKEIVQVHCIRQQRTDGAVVRAQTWIRLPDCLRDEDPDDQRIIIDNGLQRLTLDTSLRQARFSDTFKDAEPPGEHWLFGQIEVLRGRRIDDDIVLTRIEEESTEDTLVFSVQSSQAEGKVWIAAAGMLPLKVEARLTGDPNSQHEQSATITFDYRPIPDEVFALKIPDGYTELPPKEAGVFSGHVVDLSGNPLAGAVVHVKAPGLPNDKPLAGLSNEKGAFNIRMPMNLAALQSPVVVWAVVPNEPGFVGWTLLQSDLDKERHALPDGEIPGDPGVINVSPDYKVTKTPEGMSWTAGWCTGASDMVLFMEQAGRIVGRVTDVSGTGIAGASVNVRFALEKETGGHIYSYDRFWSTEVLTDAEGRYLVGSLPRLSKNSSRALRVAADGYVTEARTLTSDGPLELLTVDIRMHRAGLTVRGVLKDNYGVPLSDRPIFATVDGRKYFGCSTRSDVDGRFELKGCPDAQGLGVFVELTHNPHAHGSVRDAFVYYPDVAVDVQYEAGRTEYEVELIAAFPELTINVDVLDATGHPLAWYPVEIRADVPISTQWKLDRGFYAVADEAGFCQLSRVPDLPGLKVVLSGQYYTSSYQHLPESQRRAVQECAALYRNKFRWTEVPIEIEPGRREYYVRAVVLTHEEPEPAFTR